MLRPEQLDDQVHFLLSTLIQREVRDPDLGFLTLTAVRLTADRSLARVYYTVLGDQAQVERSRKALERAAGFLRSHLAKRLRMRRVPQLQFIADNSIARGAKILEIINKLEEV